MNRIKMKLLNYGRDKTWTIGLYFGEIDGSPVVVMQVLPEGASNIQACMEGIVLKVRDQYFPSKRKLSTVRWIEYWPKRYFPRSAVEISEIHFHQEKGKDIGSPSWGGLSESDRAYIIDEIVAPIEV